MGKILTQEEIDLLLGSASELRNEPASASPSGPSTQTVNSVHYDFRRPDRISKDQVRSLHLLHDRFARDVSASLSAYLRAVTDVSIVSVEQLTYAEFLMSLPDPTAFYAIGMPPADGIGALELNPVLAFTMIDRILGGRGRGVRLTRALTEIEQNVVDGIIHLVLGNLTETWRSVHEVHFRISGRDTRPQMLQVVPLNEIVLIMVFDVRLGEARGMLNFCLPAAIIEGFGEIFKQGFSRSSREPSEGNREHLKQSLGRVRMPVTAFLEMSLSARELVQLRPGDVLAMGQSVSQPINVRVGVTPKFTGQLMRNQNHVAVSIGECPGTAWTPETQGA